jgi:hypothetical protein
MPDEVYEWVVRRDRGRCRWCGTRKDTHAHHVRYLSEANGPGHEPSNLVLLCPLHHNMVHADKKKYQHVLLALIWMRDVEGKEYTVPEMTRYLGEA